MPDQVCKLNWLEAWSQGGTILSAAIAFGAAIIAYKTYIQFKRDNKIARAQDIFSEYLKLRIEYNDRMHDSEISRRIVSYKLYALEEIFSICVRKSGGGIIRKFFRDHFTSILSEEVVSCWHSTIKPNNRPYEVEICTHLQIYQDCYLYDFVEFIAVNCPYISSRGSCRNGFHG